METGLTDCEMALLRELEQGNLHFDANNSDFIDATARACGYASGDEMEKSLSRLQRLAFVTREQVADTVYIISMTHLGEEALSPAKPPAVRKGGCLFGWLFV